jgi:hypothetical protein
MLKKKYLNNMCRMLMLLICISLLFPAQAIIAAPTESETAIAAAAAKNVEINFEKAAATAEKMYYCGELYLFSDSMMKINYEMAAISAGLKEYISNSRLFSDKSTLTNLIKQYNSISDTYNSWVDVRPILEKYVEIIGDDGIYTKSQLQTAFRVTLATIGSTKALIESAKGYEDSISRDQRDELTKEIDAAIRRCANANRQIESNSARCLKAYRSFFDEFASFSGVKIEIVDEAQASPIPAE